jgi:hypothetical protein
MAGGDAFYAQRPNLTPVQMPQIFRAGVGSSHETPDQLAGELLDGARMLLTERGPWEGETPLAQLERAPFPTLVISGGHSPVFEIVCDTIATRLGAQRAVIEGRDHTIPATGAPYNDRLHAFLSECEQRRAVSRSLTTRCARPARGSARRGRQRRARARR